MVQGGLKAALWEETMDRIKSKHHIILYSFLSLALVVAVFLGLSYGLQAQASSRALEDAYTQRMLETQELLQSIGIKLEKVTVSTDPRSQCDLLTGISKQADGVMTNLSSLPLSHVAMSNTVKFCNQLSEYTLGLALTLAGGGSLTEDDIKQLEDMQSQCALLLGQFVTARDTMLQESLRLSTTDNVYYQEAQLTARPLEQVSDHDNGMDYPAMIYDGAFSDARHNGTPKALGNETVSAAQAVEIAIAYIGVDHVKEATEGVSTEGALAAHGVTLTLNDGTVLNAEVTKQGGKPLLIMPEHAAFSPTLSLEECENGALQFLREHGYGTMEANHYQVYNGLAVINFVAVQDGVLLYPDLVKLQIRMDNGQVVGLEANNYLLNHVQRSGLTPTLTEEEALSKVSDRLTKSGARLCVIPFKNTERLCYEVTGTYEDNEYRVYIDADTGEEVQVLMILQTTSGVMSA